MALTGCRPSGKRLGVGPVFILFLVLLGGNASAGGGKLQSRVWGAAFLFCLLDFVPHYK